MTELRLNGGSHHSSHLNGLNGGSWRLDRSLSLLLVFMLAVQVLGMFYLAGEFTSRVEALEHANVLAEGYGERLAKLEASLPLILGSTQDNGKKLDNIFTKLNVQ